MTSQPEKMLTPEIVTRIEELLGKATKGPWSIIPPDKDCKSIFMRREFGEGQSRFYVCRITDDDNGNDDAKLVCLLRNHIEELLAERKRHVEALERLSKCGLSTQLKECHEIIRRVMAIAKQALGGGEQ
jgi:hypothetical protein